ncbi:cytochrome c biogenesis protein CcdA [Desulfosarcina sp. OttesenSCG-928-G10]|nr:cytochrome c biogenesis protein CcdA [Desulfosarcina sp. OttesenSCG-928-G10]MDL2321301.1 cytochrome c biogenesis protein CcdA [Desulfosarcina sp. OttesenSCG-928-B08]
MFSAQTVSWSAALLAGLLSFFSPCILPLIPAYFTFITGFSLNELTHENSAGMRIRIVVSTLIYVLGFSTVFVLMGASASYIGGLVYDFRDWIRIIGGILMVVMGLYMMGLFRFHLMDRDYRVHVRKQPLRFFGIFLVGMAFGAGWSPCVGPLLGSILVIAGTQSSVYSGMGLLAIYSAGLAIPFLTLAVFADSLLRLIKKASWSIKYTSRIGGGLLVAIGLLLVTNVLYTLI